MNSIIYKVSDNLKNIINPQSEFKGIFDYVQLVENISDLTFETARQIFEETTEEMDAVFRYSHHRVHQFYVKCKRTRTLITPFGRVNINRTIYLDRVTGKTYCYVDEKYIHLNTGKNKMVKSAVIFEGVKGTKRRTLINKHHVMGMRELFWENVADVLHERYDVGKIKLLYFIGDGASWIKEAAKYINLDNTTNKFLLDKFHFKQAINRITKDEEEQNVLVDTIIENRLDSFNKLIDIIKSNNPERIDKIEQQAKYILNHQPSIRRSYKYNISCSMESSISHTLASNFTRNPNAYSQNNLEIYVNHRMNHLNGYNLKELYLQSLSVDEQNGIKSLKTSSIDWSILEKKKHQTKFDVKGYLNALIARYEI